MWFFIFVGCIDGCVVVDIVVVLVIILVVKLFLGMSSVFDGKKSKVVIYYYLFYIFNILR